MTDRLKGKVAIVTGSGQGIGKAIAIGLAKEGARVITNNRSPGNKGGDAETAANEINSMGGQAVPFFGDISSFEVAGNLVKKALDKFGRLDILVNNAGYHLLVPPWEITEQEWDRAIGVILKGAFNCSRHAIPLMMKQKWGRIINCTSGAWIYTTNSPGYASAKAGIVGFTRALAADLAQYGITCNAYHPYADTGLASPMSRMSGVLKRRFDMGAITKEEYEHSLNRPSPEGIGPMIAYLATDEAGKINGKVFYTSAGWFAIYTEETKKRTIIKKEGLWTVEELIERVPKELLAEG